MVSQAPQPSLSSDFKLELVARVLVNTWEGMGNTFLKADDALTLLPPHFCP